MVFRGTPRKYPKKRKKRRIRLASMGSVERAGGLDTQQTYLAEIAVEDGGADGDGGDGLDGVGGGGVGGIVDVDAAVPRGGSQVVGDGRPAQGRDGVLGALRKLDVAVQQALARGRRLPLGRLHLDVGDDVVGV